MESPIKFQEEIKKAKATKKDDAVIPVKGQIVNSSSLAVKAVMVFVVVLGLIGLIFLYFLGNSLEEVQVNQNTNKTEKSSKVEEPSNFKRASNKTVTYTNRGYGFQLAMDESRSNYKTSVEPSHDGFVNAVLNLYFPTSGKGLEDSDLEGYEKILGIHIYTKQGWQDYQDSCSKDNSCKDIKIGENNIYVFAKPKSDGSSDSEADQIANSLKTVDPEILNPPKVGSEPNGNNKSSNSSNSNSQNNKNNNSEGLILNANSNQNNNLNPFRKENCSYPSGNIALWWSTASDRERRCFVQEHGEPDFGNNEPYFCDYADSDYCLVTK